MKKTRYYRLGVWTILLVAVCACRNGQENTGMSEVDKQAVKDIITRVQKSDSLNYYIEQYIEEENYYGLCLAYNALGRNYRNRAEYAEALIAHNKARDYAVMAVDTPEIVQAYNNLGTDYRRLGELKEASLHHYRALEYCEKYSDKSSYGAVKNRVVSLNGIGNIHLSMGDMKVAERAFRQALAGETQLGSDLGRAINFANLGAIFESYEQYDSAKVYYTHSMECNQKINSVLGISLCHDHFGRLHEIAEEYDSALVEYGKAYALMHGNHDTWHALKAAISIARVYMHQGDRNRAYPYLQEAVTMAEATQSYGYMAEACRMLATYEEQSGNHKAALEHYKRSVAYNDSVYNEENQQQLRDSYVGYEKEQNLQQVENIRSAYETEVRAKQQVILAAIAIGVCALIIIVLLWYVQHTRRINIRMLQRMERMRTTFFTNITHEFRTPLTVILGLSQQLQKEQMAHEEEQRYLASIEKQGDSLLGLVNQLLDLTRLASGVEHAEWVKGNIVEYVRHTIEGYADYAQLHKVKLTVHTQHEELALCFVPEYIDKIVRNLLSNALKYTPEGGYIVVDLITEGDKVVLQVTDSGRGIPTEDLPHVFELFYQGDNNKDMVGTGVGLPFVKQMAEEMGGTVEARNTKNEGAQLRVKIPQQQPQSIATRSKAWTLKDMLVKRGAEERKKEAAVVTAGEKRPVVLIAEDNNNIAEYIEILLGERYEVHTAHDGYEALLRAEELNPDLLITDIMMPEMDGYELCSQIRQSDFLCHIPLIIVSARGEDADRIRGFEEGADAYLQKPFNAEELMVLVEKLIEQRNMLKQRFEKILSHGADANDGLSKEDADFLIRLNRLVNDNMDSGMLCVEFLAERMRMSRSQLYRKIRTLTGYSTNSYILNIRMKRAKQMLLNSTDSVSDIAMRCGFDDTSYFTRIFRNTHGCTPTQIRKNLKEE